MRYVQIFLGAWLMLMAVTEAQWFLGACGGFLLYLGIANKGCPLLPGGCSVTPDKNANNAKDVTFEEVTVSGKK